MNMLILISLSGRYAMEFETFEDKSSAINADTGVNKRLADMQPVR